jgi:hypothetical protein
MSSPVEIVVGDAVTGVTAAFPKPAEAHSTQRLSCDEYLRCRRCCKPDGTGIRHVVSRTKRASLRECDILVTTFDPAGPSERRQPWPHARWRQGTVVQTILQDDAARDESCKAPRFLRADRRHDPFEYTIAIIRGLRSLRLTVLPNLAPCLSWCIDGIFCPQGRSQASLEASFGDRPVTKRTAMREGRAAGGNLFG